MGNQINFNIITPTHTKIIMSVKQQPKINFKGITKTAPPPTTLGAHKSKQVSKFVGDAAQQIEAELFNIIKEIDLAKNENRKRKSVDEIDLDSTDGEIEWNTFVKELGRSGIHMDDVRLID